MSVAAEENAAVEQENVSLEMVDAQTITHIHINMYIYNHCFQI